MNVLSSSNTESKVVQNFINDWRSHGFVVLHLNEEQIKVIKDVDNMAQNFFALPQEIKDRCTTKTERYIGYHCRKDLCKEFFSI